MCGRKSRIGSRVIATGLCLFVLVASPCFAASFWGALFAGDSAEGAHIVSENPGFMTSPEESSQEVPTALPPAYNERTLRDLQKQLEALQRKQEDLQEQSTKLANSSEEFLTLSQNSLAMGEITDAQYQEMLATAQSLASSNSEQADRIAELEAETGTRAYMLVDAIVGFEGLVPTYGAGLTLGLRIGNHLMTELGADYTIGEFNATKPVRDFSMDNFEFRAGIGWMF